MDTIALPPMPDPVTGLPRPPHAPLAKGWTPGHPDRNPKWKPIPPPEQGPVLESFQHSKRTSLIAAALMALIEVTYSAWRDPSFQWIRIWWYWLVMFPWGPLIYFGIRGTKLAAGAAWLQCGGKKEWVQTYALKEIKLKPFGATLHLILIDQDDRRVSKPLHDIQADRQLWDLVYNGILHSVHRSGVSTNPIARILLKLE